LYTISAAGPRTPVSSSFCPSGVDTEWSCRRNLRSIVLCKPSPHWHNLCRCWDHVRRRSTLHCKGL
jgi:hypothetical protein